MILGYPNKQSKTIYKPSNLESSLSIVEYLDQTKVEPQPGLLDITTINQDKTIYSTTLISQSINPIIKYKPIDN